MEKYQIIQNKHGYKTIFDTKTGQQVSGWWQHININAENSEVEYYIAYDSEYECAIFHIDNPNEPVSQWWREIGIYGLLSGQSDYYTAQNQNREWAIFHKDNPNEPITQWWDKIYGNDVLQGKSEYYMTRDYKYERAIFHINNLYEPISDWHNYIFPLGLINGTSEYYATSNKSAIQIYHYTNKTQPVYELPNAHRKGLLYLTDDVALYLTDKHLMMYNMRKMQHYVISKLPKDMKTVLNRKYGSYLLYDIDTEKTYELINKFSSDNFIPIFIRHPLHQDIHIYLFTTNGEYIREFRDEKDIVDYIEQQQLARQNNDVDMLRLY